MKIPETVIDDVRTRLRRAAGQVQAVERMLAEGRECREVVTQISAATKALEQAGFKLVAAGLTYCVVRPEEAAQAVCAPPPGEQMLELFLSTPPAPRFLLWFRSPPPRPRRGVGRPPTTTRPPACTSRRDRPIRRRCSRLAAFSARHRRGVITVWLLVAFAAAPLALTLTGALSGAGWEAQGSTSQQVRDELRRDFPEPRRRGPGRRVPPGHADRVGPGALRQLVSQLRHAPHANAVANPLTLPAAAGLISRDGHTALVPVALAVRNDAQRPVAAGELGSYVGKLTLAPGAQAKVTGEWPVWSDFNKINAEALHKAELLSGLPTLILLFVAFGAMIAAGIPLLLALAGIAVGFAGCTCCRGSRRCRCGR